MSIEAFIFKNIFSLDWQSISKFDSCCKSSSLLDFDLISILRLSLKSCRCYARISDKTRNFCTVAKTCSCTQFTKMIIH